MINDANKTVDFYETHGRVFLSKHKADRVETYDVQLGKLKKAIGLRREPIHACFLGISGIGKSTLLNALIAEDRTVLPAGGIGPLTAQAIQVRYGDRASFRAEYHGKDKINQLLFALEQFYKAERKEELKVIEPIRDNPTELDEDYKKQIEEIISGDGDDRRREKKENLIKQARLMITNNPNGDHGLPYLIDGIRAIQGYRPSFESSLSKEDQERIAQLRVSVKKSSEEYAEETDDTFFTKLNSHAAGYFAPMIKTLEVRWKSELLKTGLVLVDLPGVGIAGDPYKEKTAEFLRDKAKAVILVVPKSGETEADAAALRDSGFLNRLLYSADNPSEDPVKLIVVVTRVDDVAEQRYRDDPQKSKKKWEHLKDVIEETAGNVRKQTLGQLRKEWADDEAISDQKESVLKAIENTLQIVPLTAPEYRKFISNDDDDRPFIKDETQSKVPELKELLSGLADEISIERQKRLGEHVAHFATSLKNEIDLIEAEWLDFDRSIEEQEKLAKDIDEFLMPLRDEYKNREGAFRNYLKKTIPVRIESLINDACAKSRYKINRYLGTLRDAHWGTLRASVRRGGVDDGARNIDLPNDFSLKFEEPIAEIWEKSLLQEIRKETREFAADSVLQLEKVVLWSKDQGARISMKALEAHYETIKSDARQMNMIGKEAIEELRKSVIEKMINRIKGPIKRKCDAFVVRGNAMGPGVKDSILRLFDTLSEETVEAAKEPATELIIERFKEVEREILTSFKKLEDPLSAIRETIIGSHRKDIERRDKKTKETIIQDVALVRKKFPEQMLEIHA